MKKFTDGDYRIDNAEIQSFTARALNHLDCGRYDLATQMLNRAESVLKDGLAKKNTAYKLGMKIIATRNHLNSILEATI